MTKQVPQGYKQTPVGVIPEDWEVVKLGDVLKIGSGKDYKHLGHGNVPVYGSGGYMLSVDKFLYDGDSACIGRKGTIDKPMFLSGKFWTVDTLFFTHSFKNTFPKYIYMVFLDIDWLLYNEASGVPSLTKSAIENIQISLPPIKEQEKIVEILSTWDDAISKQEELIEQKQQFKKSIMQQIFSQKLRFKDDDGSEYPAWDYLELEELLKYEQPTKYIVNNTDYSDEFLTPVLTAGKTFILGYTNEVDGIFKEKLPVIIFDDFTTSNQYVDFEFKVKSSAMKILLPINEYVNIKYVYERLQFIDFALGDEHKRYWISEFSKQVIEVPCFKEQNKIADFLSMIDQEISKQNQVLAELKTQKKSLMQKLLTGQVRVHYER